MGEGKIWSKWRQETPEYCPYPEIPTVQITSLLLCCVMPKKIQNIQHEWDLASNEGVFSCVSCVTHMYKFPLCRAEIKGFSQYHRLYRYPISFKITQVTCDSFKDLVNISEHAQEKNTLQDHQLKDETSKEGFLNLSNRQYLSSYITTHVDSEPNHFLAPLTVWIKFLSMTVQISKQIPLSFSRLVKSSVERAELALYRRRSSSSSWFISAQGTALQRGHPACPFSSSVHGTLQRYGHGKHFANVCTWCCLFLLSHSQSHTSLCFVIIVAI